MDDEREEELSSIAAIFPELALDSSDRYTAFLDIPVQPSVPLAVVFPSPSGGAPPKPALPPTAACLPTPPSSYSEVASLVASVTAAQDTHQLSYLPPLRLKITLPEGYPSEKPPQLQLSTSPSWLPADTLRRLEEESTKLWDEYGRGQVVFAYIDFLQQEAERAFDLVEASVGVFEIAQDLKIELLDFDMKMRRKKFEQETFDCGVCLEPKKGIACYRMSKCGHVFCIACLQDFYNSCIKEGDVASVRCIDVSCGSEDKDDGRKRRKSGTLNPNELLQIPLERSVVVRYVELKRKKKLESDKSTIWCPRQWCQGPARSKRHPKPADPLASDGSESESEDEKPPPVKDGQDKVVERLAICEDCEFAFCRVCLASWHGDFVRCGPRSKEELSAEEKASDDYIRAHTTPCPACFVPCQKTHGCNHMRCFQCRTHFCYLCSSWLDAGNPYQHFNTVNTDCYERLWDLEEGDNGQNNGNIHFLGVRGAEVAAIAHERARAQEAAALVVEEQRNEPAGVEALERVMRHLNVVVGDGANARVPARAPPVQLQRAEVPEARHRRPRNEMNGQRGLQRFLEMVQNDEEDEWDSDELDDDENDEGWQIPRA